MKNRLLMFLRNDDAGDNPGGELPIPTPPENPTPATLENGGETGTPPATSDVKTFTQEQVNEIVRERLKDEQGRFYKKHGYESEELFNAALEKSRNYDGLKTSSDETAKELASLKEASMLEKNKIADERIDDVKTYFKGKELELNDENLKAEIERHPEWIKKIVVAAPTVGGAGQANPGTDEKSNVMKLFGY